MGYPGLSIVFLTSNTLISWLWRVHASMHDIPLTVMFQWINELVQERRNSIANALEFRLSCTNNPLISYIGQWKCIWANSTSLTTWDPTTNNLYQGPF